MRGLRFRPVAPDNWADLEALFAAHGILNGCWCLWWRLARNEFDRMPRPEKRAMLRAQVEAGKPLGVLGYDGDRPVAWIAVAPREDTPVLGRSRNLKPVDDAPVWSVTCFFVEREWRGRGVMVDLLNAAGDYAKSCGASLLEGYPIDPGGGRDAVAHMFPGSLSAFRRAGYEEVARRAPKRPIMRRKPG